jgi:hypothetical protein
MGQRKKIWKKICGRTEKICGRTEKICGRTEKICGRTEKICGKTVFPIASPVNLIVMFREPGKVVTP